MEFLTLVGGLIALVFAVVFSFGVLANAEMTMNKEYSQGTRMKAFLYFLGHLAFVIFLATGAYWLLWR